MKNLLCLGGYNHGKSLPEEGNASPFEYIEDFMVRLSCALCGFHYESRMQHYDKIVGSDREYWRCREIYDRR